LVGCTADLAAVPVADETCATDASAAAASATASAVRCVASPAAAQPAEGVRAGEQKAGDHVGGQVHVDQLVPEVAVREQRLERCTSTTWPWLSRKPVGWFIQPFTEITSATR
jgi:hypothetical protein